MARRAKNRMPRSIRLELNTKTGFYETEEDGITYQLTYAQMNEVKTFFWGNKSWGPKISEWYRSLDPFKKKEVKRINVPPAPTDFFPDQEYPD